MARQDERKGAGAHGGPWDPPGGRQDEWRMNGALTAGSAGFGYNPPVMAAMPINAAGTKGSGNGTENG